MSDARKRLLGPQGEDRAIDAHESLEDELYTASLRPRPFAE